MANKSTSQNYFQRLDRLKKGVQPEKPITRGRPKFVRPSQHSQPSQTQR